MKQEPYLRAAAALCACGMLLLVGVSSGAEPRFSGLFLDVGAPKGAPALPSIEADFESLRAHLAEQVDADERDFAIVRASGLSRDELRSHLQEYAGRVAPGSTAVVYLRCFVTRPQTIAAIFLYPSDASIEAPVDGVSEAGATPIRDNEFYEWLRAFTDATVVLVLDLRTEDRSLMRFYGTRSNPPVSALTAIARVDGPHTVAEYLIRALSPATDGDRDGVITFGELVGGLQQSVYTDLTSSDIIVAGTGPPDLVVYEVPAAIVVETRPDGAEIIIDGEAVGEAPVRHAPVVAGTYEVGARLPGYRLPSPEPVEVGAVTGTSYRVSFELEPIRVRGDVAAPDAGELSTIAVAVTPETELHAELEAPGAYEFVLDSPGVALGETYRVRAGTLDDRFFGDAEFVFEGTEDIVRDVALEERSPWEIAAIRYEAGFTDEALTTAVGARDAAYEIPGLGEDFALFLIEAWAPLTTDARSMIACALLTEQLGDVETAREYWGIAKGASPRGSSDYERAAESSPDPGRVPVIIVAGVLLVLIVVSALRIVRRRRPPPSATGLGGS